MNVPTNTGPQPACSISPHPWDEVGPDPEQLWREIAMRCWQRVHPDREPGDGDIPTAAEVAECMGLTGPLANGPAWREFLSRWNDLVVTAIEDFLSAAGNLLPAEMKWVDLLATTGKGRNFVDHPTILALLASDYVHFLEVYFRLRERKIGLQSFQGKVEDLLHLVELVEQSPYRRRLFVRCGASLLKITAAHAALSAPLAGPSQLSL